MITQETWNKWNSSDNGPAYPKMPELDGLRRRDRAGEDSPEFVREYSAAIGRAIHRLNNAWWKAGAALDLSPPNLDADHRRRMASVMNEGLAHDRAIRLKTQEADYAAAMELTRAARVAHLNALLVATPKDQWMPPEATPEPPQAAPEIKPARPRRARAAGPVYKTIFIKGRALRLEIGA